MSFGPRYFAMLAAVLLLLCAGAEEWIRERPARLAAWTLAAGFSIVVHALGAYMTWPGSFAVDAQIARAWDFSLHPLLNLLAADGALFKLPLAARAVVAAACGWACLGLARALRRVVQ
jgi:hypothetical protein